MLYLLDADTIITADRDPYPLSASAIFWDWIAQMGRDGQVKIPIEQYEEITDGTGDIVDWLKRHDIREALLLDEQADPAEVQRATEQGYAPDLTDDEVEQIGRDPFLISYALVSTDRTVVTFEVSKPSKRRANRKIPDVCRDFGIPTCTLYEMMRALGFTMTWRPAL